MKNNKVKFFLLTSSTLVIIITSIFLFRKVSYSNLSSGNDHNYWDGVTVSQSLSGSGTSADPYLISNGADFAKFVDISNSQNNIYHYKLTANIYLNKGYFFYDHYHDEIIYHLENTEYYIDKGTKYYYNTPSPINHNYNGSINSISTINSFRGTLDGDGKSIIGLYVYDENNTDDSVSLFEVMTGGYIKNINFLNSVIMGKGDVGLINRLQRGNIENIIYNGVIYNYKSSLEATTVNGQATYNNNTISLSVTPEPNNYIYYGATITGTSNTSFQYNNRTYNAGSFTIKMDYPTDSITLTPISGTLNITNLSYTVNSYEKTSCGFIANYYSDSTNSDFNLKNISIHGTISGWANTGALIGKIWGQLGCYHKKRTIQDCYNNAKVYSKYIAGGLIGYVEGNDEYEFKNLYNNGKIEGRLTGGIIGSIKYNINNMAITYKNIFNNSDDYTSDGQIIGSIQLEQNITYSSPVISDVYFIHNGKTALGTSNLSNPSEYNIMQYKSRENLLTVSTLNSMEYDDTNGYTVTDGKIPYFETDDVDAPSITIELEYGSNTWTNADYYNQPDKVIIPIDYVYDLSYSYIENSEIGCISAIFYDDTDEYLDDMLEDTIKADISTGNHFNIEENTSNILYVRIIDEYGNIGIARSDLIISDPYTYIASEGVNHNNMDFLNSAFFYMRLIRSNIQFNIYVNHELEIDYFPYDTTSKLYFRSDKLLPNDTELYLYDYIADDIYKLTITSQITPIYITNGFGGEDYYYDLSLFSSIYNSNNSYDNLLINHYNGNKIKDNIEIIINYKNVENTIMHMNQGIAIKDNNNNTYTGLNNGNYSIVPHESHNSYNLTTTPNGTLELSNSTSNISFNYSVSNNINRYNNPSNLIYDQIYNYTQKYLKIEVVDSNNNKVSNFVPFNITYGYGGNTYQSSNDSTTYIPITSDTGTITASVINTNNLDVKSGNYNLKVTVCNKYSSDISGSSTIPITINNAQPINNNSFQVEIDAGDKFINKNTGQTNSNDTNFDIHFKYIGTLNTPMARIKIKKFNESSNSYTLTNVNPNTIFNQVFNAAGVYSGDTYYHLLPSYLTSNQQYNISIPIKTSSLPEGKYIISVALFNGKRVSEEKYNIIIK